MQDRFCQEYIKDLNANAAAKRAGYKENKSRCTPSRLLTYPQVKKRIAELKKKLLERNEDLAQQVIDELAKIAFSNVQDFIKDGNTVVDLSAIEAKKAAAVSSIKKVTRRFDTLDTSTDDVIQETIEFKLWDKGAALERLGRHLGIFEADNKQKGPLVITVTDTDE